MNCNYEIGQLKCSIFVNKLYYPNELNTSSLEFVTRSFCATCFIIRKPYTAEMKEDLKFPKVKCFPRVHYLKGWETMIII